MGFRKWSSHLRRILLQQKGWKTLSYSITQRALADVSTPAKSSWDDHELPTDDSAASSVVPVDNTFVVAVDAIEDAVGASVLSQVAAAVSPVTTYEPLTAGSEWFDWIRVDDKLCSAAEW